MDTRYSQALRGLRAEGAMGDFLKAATAVLTEQELRALAGAANFELERYKKFQLRYPATIGAFERQHALSYLVGKTIADFTDADLSLALLRKYSLSKTMVKALKKERKKRKK